MKVNNMPGWAQERAFVVIRIVNGEAWFYDAWDDGNKAINQALEEYVGGMVIPASEAEPA